MQKILISTLVVAFVVLFGSLQPSNTSAENLAAAGPDCGCKRMEVEDKKNGGTMTLCFQGAEWKNGKCMATLKGMDNGGDPVEIEVEVKNHGTKGKCEAFDKEIKEAKKQCKIHGTAP